MGETKITKDLEKRELIIERVLDAQRDRVWAAYTDADKLAKWWGPRGWETTIKNFDFRPEGVWHYCMKCVDKDQGSFYGQESWGKAVFHHIDEPNSFTYTDYFSDAEGAINNELPATEVMMDFIEEDGKTRLVCKSTYASTEGLQQVLDMGMVEGLTQTLDRLEEFVTGRDQL